MFDLDRHPSDRFEHRTERLREIRRHHCQTAPGQNSVSKKLASDGRRSSSIHVRRLPPLYVAGR